MQSNDLCAPKAHQRLDIGPETVKPSQRRAKPAFDLAAF
jgi:hypothetical protein